MSLLGTKISLLEQEDVVVLNKVGPGLTLKIPPEPSVLTGGVKGETVDVVRK